MPDYIPNTEKERAEMLAYIGADSVSDLYKDVPESLKLASLDLPEGLSSQETEEKLRAVAKKNRVYSAVLRGAGAYDHYIPPVVKAITSLPQFVTAYTPYQAELSQGVLRSIFEYQSYMCALTGMDVSNAGVYNGATAAAEAVIMTKERNRNKLVIAGEIRPDTMSVLKTYLSTKGVEILVADTENGVASAQNVKSLMDDTVCAVYLEQPQYNGLLSDARAIGNVAKEYGAKYIMGVNPLMLALTPPPAECGADIAVGDAQPFGMSLSFGGPYLGFMTCKTKEMRKIPGRIVGKTTDANGKECYVLTLQPREQHIKRERALSNICSNQALCSLTATVYLGAMGKEGLREVASACVDYAHYASAKFEEKGLKREFDGEFFHEFTTVSVGNSDKILDVLDKADILGGLKLDDDRLLWCFTEKCSKEVIDRVANLIGGAIC